MDVANLVGLEMTRAEGRGRPGAQVNREAELSLLVSWLLCANCPPEPWNLSILHPTAQEHARSPPQFATKGQPLPFLKSGGKYDFAWLCHTEVNPSPEESRGHFCLWAGDTQLSCPLLQGSQQPSVLMSLPAGPRPIRGCHSHMQQGWVKLNAKAVTEW